MHLNGWTRLWIVLAALHLAAVLGGGVVAFFPDRAPARSELVARSIELELHYQADQAQKHGDERAELDVRRSIEKGGARVSPCRMR